MFKGIIITVCILLGLISASPASAQKLVIRMNSGIENLEGLNTIQKLYFSEGDLVVDFYSGADDIYGISEVQKLYFDNTVSVAENTLADDRTVGVYPNPAFDIITITGIPVTENHLNIYSMDGGLVMQIPVSAVTVDINVAGLKSGLYLVNAAGFSTKFVKK
jgi:hypothetical protein